MSKENVLVTGGAGFVGSILIRKLLSQGYKVTVLDNLYKDGRNIAELTKNENFTFINADVTDKKQMSHLGKLYNFDVVVALAGLVGAPICHKYPSLSREVNYEGVYNTLKHFGEGKKFIFSSSGSVYGNVPSGLCVETLCPKPLSEYGEDKLLAEDLLFGDALIYRFSTGSGYSQNMRIKLLPHEFCHDAFYTKTIVISQPEFQRSFISVQDMADSIIFGIENYQAMLDRYPDGIFNVGKDSNNWSKRELAEYVCSKTGAKLFINDDLYFDADGRNYSISFDKIKSVGFECKYTMENIIDEVLKVMPFYPDKPRID